MDCLLFAGSWGSSSQFIETYSRCVLYLDKAVDLFVRVWPMKSSKNEPKQILMVFLSLILSKIVNRKM